VIGDVFSEKDTGFLFLFMENDMFTILHDYLQSLENYFSFQEKIF